MYEKSRSKSQWASHREYCQKSRAICSPSICALKRTSVLHFDYIGLVTVRLSGIGLNRIREHVVMGSSFAMLSLLPVSSLSGTTSTVLPPDSMNRNEDNVEPTIKDESPFGKLSEDLLIEIFIRVPITKWDQISCVRKQWATLFRGECLWQAALNRAYPLASKTKRWIGPIRQGLSKRRYVALNISRNILGVDTDIDEMLGHIYLFLKDQLQLSTTPASGILHGTLIDQLIVCGKSKDKADELVTKIWLALLDNLEDTKHTFIVLKSIAQEYDGFLPYPYSRPIKMQWKVFERLFVDFRDLLDHSEYCDLIGIAKKKFQTIPYIWLGY